MNESDLLSSSIVSTDPTDLMGKLTVKADWNWTDCSNNAVIYTDPLLATSTGGYYSNLSTNLFTDHMFSSEGVLEIIKSGFETYGFEFNGINSIQEKETSQDIRGWVSAGFLENNKYCGIFHPWLSLVSSYTLPKSIILTVKEDSYFENFSVKILLDNNLVLIDSLSGIVHIVQEMLLENLQKAINNINEKFESKTTTNVYSVGRQGTTSSNYWTNGVYYSNFDADTSISVNNSGFQGITIN